MIGQTLGHYRVLEKIGAGGMGEVYRARDERLGRDVAIKVLPEAFARDIERLTRFEREARLLAALNHPNIAAIHGLEEADGVRFLVFELVEGETLAEQLEKRQLPLEEAFEICRQIAEALEVAHEKGIIHRDLKPANVKVTPEGKVKVLDFGLAKAFGGEEAADLSRSPTVTEAATRAGVLLGTAAYMSPEQARGKPVDKRTDIWSFGCVLYEALTGKQAFSGETVSDTIAAILKGEPNWAVLPGPTPPTIHLLLRRCLQKEPARRLHDIADARLEIDEALSAPATAAPTAIAPSHALGWRRALPWTVAGLLAVGLVLSVLGWWRATRPVEQTPMRLQVRISAVEAPGTQYRSLVLSPDGKLLAYPALVPGGPIWAIYLRPMDRLEARPLSGTGGARWPFFSPDSQWIGFFAGGKLKKVPVSGGAPINVCDAAGGQGRLTWGPDDTIVFSREESGLFRVSAAGGEPEELTKRSEGEYTHRWPRFLPGGRALLFVSLSRTRSFNEANIEVLDLRSGRRKLLHRGGSAPSYLPTGHLVFVREATLFAAPFDTKRLELSNSPVPVLEDVSFDPDTGYAAYSFSESGTLLYRSGPEESIRVQPAWVDYRGKVTRLPLSAGDYWKPTLSPDGTRLAIQQTEQGNRDIWVYDLLRGGRTRLTFDPASDYWPVWSPDGRQIAFGSYQSGPSRLFRKRADGSVAEVPLTDGMEQSAWANSWSPDGTTLAFTRLSAKGGAGIWTLPPGKDGRPAEPELFLDTPFTERDPVFSPDGRWLAYMSNESGRWEVYVRPFPKGEGQWQISTEGGWNPRWAKNGRELFYRNGEKMMVVSYVAAGGAFPAQPPRLLFEVPTPAPLTYSTYDVTPDGKHFLVLLPEENQRAAGPTHFTLVLNWFEELKRRVPPSKD